MSQFIRFSPQIIFFYTYSLDKIKTIYQHKMEQQNRKLPNITKISKYNVEHSFTAGGQGQVYLCSFDKKLYAIKIPLRQKDSTIQKFVKQSTFIKNLDDQNIIKLVEFQNSVQVVCEDKSKIQSAMTVLEFAEQGDLFDYSIKRAYSQEICRTILGQIVSAMRYLHYEKKVMHLDLKTQNILVTKDFHFKVTDFGHAKKYQQIQNLTHQFSYGTQWWVPPEYGNFNQFNGQKIDVFNCGLILCKLATSTYPIRKTPFVRNDQLYCLLKRSRYESFWHYFRKRIPHINLSKNLQRLLLCMIQPNPKKRYTFQQVIEDDWFVNTVPAPLQAVKAEFQKQKNILLNDPSTKQSRQKLEQIKKIFQKIQVQTQIHDNKSHNTNSNSRGAGQHEIIYSLYAQYLQLRSDKIYDNLVERNKYGIPYCSYKPEFIILYLKNQLQKRKSRKQVLFTDSFGIYTPIEYKLQFMQPKHQGIIRIKCLYHCPASQNDIQIVQSQKQQRDAETMHQHKDSSQQQLYQQIKILLYGQIVRHQDKYGVDWELKDLNMNDVWSKETIYTLKLFLKVLQDKMENI